MNRYHKIVLFSCIFAFIVVGLGAYTRLSDSGLGCTDSAPHLKDKKEASCGCAGSYTAHAALELYAEAFEEAGALDKLEAFASFNGPDFYGLPRNTETVTLVKEPWQVPESYPLGEDVVVPIRAGDEISWKVK